MVNFGLLAAEIVSPVWGTPANFNGFRVLAALLHGTLVLFISSKVMLIFLLYNKSSVVAEMGDRLATINIGRREGGCCAPFRGGELGPIKHNVAWARDLPPYQVAS